MSPISWGYLGGCLFIFLVTLAWGNRLKLTGGAVMAVDTIVAVSLFDLMLRGTIKSQQFGAIAAVIDFSLFALFWLVFREGRRHQQHRWAFFVSIAFAGRFVLTLSAAAIGTPLFDYDYVKLLNVLFAGALISLLAASFPASIEEAKTVPYLKFARLKHDLMQRVRYHLANRKRISGMPRREANKFDAAIGRRLKMARRRNELTLEEVAREFELSPSQISRYENGEVAISASLMFEFAKFFDVSIAFLMEDLQQEPMPAPDAPRHVKP